MHWIVEEVPWGNLFRTVLTGYLFFLAIGLSLAIVFPGIDGVWLTYAVALLAFVLASIVVWSDRISWIGDPAPDA